MRPLLFLVLSAVIVGRAAADDEKKVERLDAWPALSDGARVKKDVERLRKARTEEMGEEAHAALVQDGAMTAPLLFVALSKEKDEDALERIRAVLDAVTDARHTRLLAREFVNRSARVRAYCLRRATSFPDEGIREPAERALTKTEKAEKPEERSERYLAALCVTSTGSMAGMAVLVASAKDDWKKCGAEVRSVLERVRSPEAARIAAKGLAGERADTLAALRLLAGCGDPVAGNLVRPYLDSSDREVQFEAINALRGIVDGEPPIDRLPVFEMIERAEAWKKRL